MPERARVLGNLAQIRDLESLPAILDLAKAGALRGPAIVALGQFEDPRIAPLLIQFIVDEDKGVRPLALNNLAGRAESSRALLAAIDAGKFKKDVLSAPLASKIRGFNDAKMNAWLEKNWGTVNASSEDKAKAIANYKKFLGTDAILRAAQDRKLVLVKGSDIDPPVGRGVTVHRAESTEKKFMIGASIRYRKYRRPFSVHSRSR